MATKPTIKASERCHVVFIFNFEHIQQINLMFLLLTLNINLSAVHKIKTTKELKDTMKAFDDVKTSKKVYEVMFSDM